MLPQLITLFGVGIVAGIAHTLIYFLHIVPYLTGRNANGSKSAKRAYKENMEAYFALRSDSSWLRLAMRIMRGLFLIAWLVLVVAIFQTFD